MKRLLVGLVFLGFGLAAFADPPIRNSQEKLRAAKALLAVKAFTGEDGRFLPETVLIDVGLVDRLPREDEANLSRICEILLAHMNSDKPSEIASAAGLSLYSIIKENVPTANDFKAVKSHHVLLRRWTAKVLDNKALRDQASFQQYLVERTIR